MDSTSAEQETSPAAPGPGALIADRYRLETRLGSGTFAAVYHATDVLTRQPVAVKLMGLPTGEELGVWRQEVAMLRRANLPGVVELLDAAAELGAPPLEARILQVEASIAWRYGRPEDARRLAERALGLATSTGREPIAILLESLAVGSGAPVSPAREDDLLDRVDQCEVPGLAAQSAAMLSLGGHPAHGRLREIVGRNAERLPSSQHEVRREIVSITEALDFADRACRADGA